MLKHAPIQGNGLHDYLLRESRNLLCKGYTPEIVFEELLSATKQSGRTTQDIEGEISNAIEGVVAYLSEHPNFQPSNGRKHSPIDPLSFDFSGNPRIDRRK